MEDVKTGGLGAAGKSLDMTKPMRARISDGLVPPPVPEGFSAAKGAVAVEKKYDPSVVAEKLWMSIMSGGSADGVEFEAKFTLGDGREFALRGDKEGFGTIRALETFREPAEKLIAAHHAAVKRVDVSTDDRLMTFSSYGDFLEWIEL